MAIIRAVVVGVGGIARWHLKTMLDQPRACRVQALVETSPASLEAASSVFKEKGKPLPPAYSSLKELLKLEKQPPDAALIASPHKYHFEHIRTCLNAGMHVLVEKPMVLSVKEAQSVIRLAKKVDRVVSVGFNGSYSTAIAKARQLISQGKLGKVNGIQAHVFQQWKRGTKGSWRQDPDISGGGFLFDTGSHMVNTVLSLIDDEVDTLSASLDNSGTPVEINSIIQGTFKNGSFFSMIGMGDSMHCQSLIRIFGTEGILETGQWGERLRLMGKGDHEFQEVKHPQSKPVWQEFVRVLQGKRENPAPPQLGLRFARIMESIRAAADKQ